MVLDHVPEDAGRLVVGPPILDADRFRHRELDVVHVGAVPDRLEEAVGEPEHHDVLDGLLAEIVIDPVDLGLLEDRPDLGAQRPGGGEVVPERLLDDDAPPRVPVLPDQAGRAELPDHLSEEARGDGEVEEHAAPRPVNLRHVAEQGGEAGVGRGVGVLARYVVERVAQLGPQRLVERGRGELPDVPGLLLPELRVALRRAGHPDDGQLLGEEPVGLEVVEGGQELPLGQVAGGAEDHDGARTGRPAGIGEGVGLRHGPLLAAGRRLDVTAELLAHRGEDLLGEGVLLA